jgi:hypothetical protein
MQLNAYKRIIKANALKSVLVSVHFFPGNIGICRQENNFLSFFNFFPGDIVLGLNNKYYFIIFSKKFTFSTLKFAIFRAFSPETMTPKKKTKISKKYFFQDIFRCGK